MVERVLLKVGGQVFSAWEEIAIQRSMSDLCAGFSLTLFDEQAVAGAASVIEEQAPCELWIAADTGRPDLVMTGYVDVVEQQISDRRHSLRVSGRDRTADLVDCSAAIKAYKNQTLAAIAAALVKPFGIKVTAEADVGAAFTTFAVEPGETVFEALTRLTRMRGLMLRTTPAAGLVIYDPSAERERIAPFTLGRDVVDLNTRSSSAGRYSSYRVIGQHRGGNTVAAVDAAGAKGSARDATVRRHRPLIIVSDEQATRDGCRLRAQWEATTRLGNAVSASMTVQGWRAPDGKTLLAPNLIVPVSAPYVAFEEDLILSAVILALNDRGTTAGLRLVRPEAYTTVEILESRRKKGKRKGLNWLGALGDG